MNNDFLMNHLCPAASPARPRNGRLRYASALLLGVALAACATAPSEQVVTERPIRGDGVLPTALLRPAYQAPEWGAAPPADQFPTRIATATVPAPVSPIVPPAPAVAAVAVAPVVAAAPTRPAAVPNPYLPVTPPLAAPAPAPVVAAPAAAVSVPARAPMAPAPAADEPPAFEVAVLEVPEPPRAAPRRQGPVTDLSALDDIRITDSRPGAAPDRAPPPPVATPVAVPVAETVPALPPAPVRLAAATTTTTATPVAPMATASAVIEAPARRPATAGGYALHLASYRNVANVASGWAIYRERHPNILGDLSARGAEVTIPGQGDFIRLLVGPFSAPDDARALCAELESLDEYCKVMPFEGTPVS